MARYSVQGLFWVDEDLDDGYVRVEGDSVPRILMSLPTYRALAFSSSLQRLLDAAWDLRGTLLLPRAVIEPEAASDLRLGLSLVDPEPSEVCVYPPCSLPAETVHEDGFPLCAEHTALMATWDDLVA